MASKVSVLGYSQNSTDQPNRRIKRSGAYSLVRRQVADWITEPYLLRMREEAIAVRAVDLLPKQAPYIPFGLDPSIDAQLGTIPQFPVLTNQVRFRHIQESH